MNRLVEKPIIRPSRLPRVRDDQRPEPLPALPALAAGGEIERAVLGPLLVHELTHLLNRTVLPSDLPPWLEV